MSAYLATDPLGYSTANLPSGITLNGATGVLSGSPIQAGTYAVSITGKSRGAGPLIFEINVAPLNPELVGVFQCWIERNNTLNKNLGSTIQITSDEKGRIQRKTAYRWECGCSPRKFDCLARLIAFGSVNSADLVCASKNEHHPGRFSG